MALSDLEVGPGKAGAGKIIDAKGPQKRLPVGISPWKLARVSTEDAARAAARARENSSILQPSRPLPLDLPLGDADTDSSYRSSLSSSGEIHIAAAGSRRNSGRKKHHHRFGKEMWSLTRSKRDRIIPLTVNDAFAPPHGGDMHPLDSEPRSPYRNPSSSSMFTGDPRLASFPPASSYPPQIKFPRYPGDVRSSFPVKSTFNSSSDVHLTSSDVKPGMGHAEIISKLATQVSTSSENILRLSATSDGYEASCGESGDDGSDAAGLSQSWSKQSWNKLGFHPPDVPSTTFSMAPIWGTDIREEKVKPWQATFSAPSKAVVVDTKSSPGGTHPPPSSCMQPRCSDMLSNTFIYSAPGAMIGV